MCGRFVPTAAEAEGWAGVVPKHDLRVTCPKSGSTGTGMIETKSIDGIDASVFCICAVLGVIYDGGPPFLGSDWSAQLAQADPASPLCCPL